MANTDTGESTAAINRRSDVNAWPRVYVALSKGADLYRPTGMTRFYTRCKDDRDDNNGVGISATFVKELEKHGNLVRSGVDIYTLPKTEERFQSCDSDGQMALL